MATMSEQHLTDRSRHAPLAGRHALITGGAKGIGLAIAETLAGLGASLTLVGRDQVALEAQEKRLGAAVITADVTDTAAVHAAVDSAQAAHGPVTILVNNAGAAESAPFARTDRALWDMMLAINVTAAFTCTQAVLPGMRAANWGRVVNIASTAGLKGYRYVTAYSAAKHALVGLTRSLALELSNTAITVNAVCPGFTDTALLDRSVQNITAKTGASVNDARAQLAEANPQGRLITPQEVAHTVAWLCHPESTSITGQAIAVAGGEVM
jgi:NAD(P)-dependent dehydrogenase (short-subunit alcohol dehydrogenase family)